MHLFVSIKHHIKAININTLQPPVSRLLYRSSNERAKVVKLSNRRNKDNSRAVQISEELKIQSKFT